MKEDIIIVGAGIIGMSLALSLSSSNKKIVIIEKNLSNSLKINRVYSISEKTKSFYELLGVWNNIDEINNIDSMSIYYRNFNQKNMITFSEKINQIKIGYITQSKNISLSLLKKIEEDDNIKLLDNCDIGRIEDTETGVKVEINNHENIEARYLFSCEGSKSSIKKNLQENNIYDDYNSKALVFNIEHTIKNNNAAHQIFLKTGPIAFLPTSNNNFSMVVSIKNKYLDNEIFQEENIAHFIEEITNKKFGEIKLTNKLISFNLIGFDSENYVVGNVVFVGDSAHSVHPLAGMGLNLGVSDIIEIIDIINSSTVSFGRKNLFSRYARRQKIINIQARRQLKFIEKIYSIDNKFIESIIQKSMYSIQKSNFIKKKIIIHANNNLRFF
mgnify:FL=1